MNNKDQSEDLIRKLMQKSEADSPSEDFTNRIMNNIESEKQVEIVPSDSKIIIWQRALLIVGGVFLVMAVLFYFRAYFEGIFRIDYLTNSFMPFFQDLLYRGAELITNQKISPVIFVIIVSVGSLMILERFLSIGKKMKSYLISF
jgi:small-conductance mechanosensitive channel